MQNRIQAEVYSLVNPGQACIQAQSPFEASIALGSYVRGTYSVWVNGEQVREFTI